MLIVLDALDESGSVDDRKGLLALLTSQLFLLPHPFRFLITSRPEDDIKDAFECQPHILIRQMDIASADDISSYLKSRMDIIRSKTKHVGLGANWPGVEVIRDLTDRASGIFLWASIASNFIDDDDPRGRINILL
jgi:hypothetical protein